MRQRSSFALCLLVLFLSLPAHAARVFVEYAIGSGVSGEDRQTVTDLVKSSVSEVGSDVLIDDFDKSDYALQPKLMRIGRSYVLSVAKVRRGRVVFTAQQKARRLDELDQVTLTVTRSAIQEHDIAQMSDRTDYAPDYPEERHESRPARRHPRKGAYFGIGGNSLQNLGTLGTSGVGLSLGLGYAWDVGQGEIRVLADGNFNGSALFAAGTLGGIYSLLSSDTAPYLGADFGVGFAKVDAGSLFAGQLVFGFAGALDAGVQLFRNSTVNLDLGLRASFLFNNNSFGMPQSYSLKLGIYY